MVVAQGENPLPPLLWGRRSIYTSGGCKILTVTPTAFGLPFPNRGGDHIPDDCFRVRITPLRVSAGPWELCHEVDVHCRPYARWIVMIVAMSVAAEPHKVACARGLLLLVEPRVVVYSHDKLWSHDESRHYGSPSLRLVAR